ncbi:MAG: COX15/CtaA family protein [Actinobacteria bacterium]|jgi:cytochrome c oxidase assembly protein subunit 15|nr:COX15/CtaA family protein [Actinomycetota bacterium]
MSSKTVSSTVFRKLTLATLVALTALIATGTWVRLSESGLGCTTWPACTSKDVIAPGTYHSLIEFTNRMTIVVIGILVVAVFVLSLLRWSRRRDLVLLSAGLIIGYLGEAVLGGITVLLKLAPPLVAAHLVLALVLVADGTVLHWRAGIDDSVVVRSKLPTLPGPMMTLSSIMMVAFWVIVILGTIVTGTGPHSGKPGTPRFHLSLGGIMEIHAAVGLVLYGVAVALWVSLLAIHAAKDTARRAHVVVILLTLQGVFGYAVWFTKFSVIPSEVHTLGSALLLIALVRFRLGLYSHALPDEVPAEINDTSAERALTSSAADTRS